MQPDMIKFIDGGEITTDHMVVFSEINKKKRPSTLGASLKSIMGPDEDIKEHYLCKSNAYVLSKDSWDEFLK